MPQSKKESPVKAWRPAPPEWERVFDEASARLAGAERRKMFGYPALFTNGNMVAGLHQSGLVLRLSDADREEFLRLPGAARFQPMPGRVMREYVVAPKALVSRPADVEAWLRRALAHAAALPPKAGARKPLKPKSQGGKKK